jgi:hypothetical protein
LFLAYVNNIWRNTESKIRLFADDLILYRKMVNAKEVKILQTDLDRLVDWAVGNDMKINPSKNKAISLLGAWMKDTLNYTLDNDNGNDNDKPIKSLLKGKVLLPPVGLTRLDS